MKLLIKQGLLAGLVIALLYLSLGLIFANSVNNIVWFYEMLGFIWGLVFLGLNYRLIVKWGWQVLIEKYGMFLFAGIVSWWMVMILMVLLIIPTKSRIVESRNMPSIVEENQKVVDNLRKDIKNTTVRILNSSETNYPTHIELAMRLILAAITPVFGYKALMSNKTINNESK